DRVAFGARGFSDQPPVARPRRGVGRPRGPARGRHRRSHQPGGQPRAHGAWHVVTRLLLAATVLVAAATARIRPTAHRRAATCGSYDSPDAVRAEGYRLRAAAMLSVAARFQVAPGRLPAGARATHLVSRETARAHLRARELRPAAAAGRRA